MLNLYKINLDAFKYIEVLHGEFSQICQPLKTYNIPWFGYFKLFENGSYFNISNNLEHTKQYLSTIQNIGVTWSEQLELVKKNIRYYFRSEKKYIYLADCKIKNFDKNKDPIFHLSYNHNQWNFIAIYKFTKGYIEQYFFAGYKDQTYLHNFFINNLIFLEQFINCFEKTDLYKKIQNSKYLAHYDQKFDFDILSTFSPEKYAFREQIKQDNILNINNNMIKLTKREYQYLQYLAIGNTAKETADILNLSARTVENYLNILKNKTGCYSRSKIVKSFLNSKGVLNKIIY